MAGARLDGIPVSVYNGVYKSVEISEAPPVYFIGVKKRMPALSCRRVMKKVLLVAKSLCHAFILEVDYEISS